jgi:DNA-binding transcriptional LysR family regulator
VQSLESVTARLGSQARQGSLSLSVAAPPMASANLLPNVIASFQASHPDVSVRLTDTSMEDISRMVKAGEVDLGFGMFIKPTPGVLRIPVFRFSLMVASLPATLKPRRGARKWSELAGKRFIGLPPENPIQQLINQYMGKVGHREPPAFVVNFLDTQIGMVAAGCGIAILPSTALPACRSRGVSMEPLTSPAAELDFYQVRDRSRKLPQCADDFTNLLKSVAVRSFAGGVG